MVGISLGISLDVPLFARRGLFNPSVFGNLRGAWDPRAGLILSGSNIVSHAPHAGSVVGTGLGILSQPVASLQPLLAYRSDGLPVVSCVSGRRHFAQIFSSDVSNQPFTIISSTQKQSSVGDSVIYGMSSIAGFTSGVLQVYRTDTGTYNSLQGYYPNSYSTRPNRNMKSSEVLGYSLGPVEAHGWSSVTPWSPNLLTYAASNIGMITIGHRDPYNVGTYSAKSDIGPLWLFQEAFSMSQLDEACQAMMEQYPELP